jgi:hypothetical protein
LEIVVKQETALKEKKCIITRESAAASRFKHREVDWSKNKKHLKKTLQETHISLDLQPINGWYYFKFKWKK